MASPRDLLARLGVRNVAGTSLMSQGGQLPQPRRGSQPKPEPAPKRQRSQPAQQQGPLSSQIAAFLKAQQAESAPVEEDDGPDGFLGGLKAAGSKALGAGVGGLMKGLEYAAVPGGTVTGLAKELIDVTLPVANKIPGLEQPYDEEAIGDGSFDFGKAWGNREGFGDLIVEPIMGEKGTDRNIWIRRLAGFAGDVATDPLTYLTGGAAQAAGKAGRRNLAARAFEEGMSEEAIKRAAKGAAFLNAGERQALNIEEAGLRFGGKNGVRVPGTAAISNAAFRTTGSAREAITRTRPWQVIANNPEHIAEAAKVLSGVPGRMTATQAASVVAWDNAHRASMKTFAEPAKEVAGQLLGKLDDKQAVALTHAIESGVAGDEVVTQTRQLLTQLRDLAQKEGVDVGEITDLGYMPHKWSKEAQAALDGTPVGADIRKLFKIDPTEATGVILKREIKGGIHRLGGKTVDLGDGSIAAINKGLSKAFPEAGITKWLDDDARDLVSYYINSLGSNVGSVKSMKMLLERPNSGMSNLEDVADEVIDKFATATANKEARKAAREVLAKRAEDLKVEKKLARQDAAKLQTIMGEKLSDLLDETNAIDKQFKSIVDAHVASGKPLDAARKAVGAKVVEVKKQAAAQLEKLEAEYFDLEQQIEAAQLRLANAGDPKVRLANFNELARRKVELQAEIDAAAGAVKYVDELTAELTEVIKASQKLREMADDPDEVQALGQRLMPEREIEVTRPLEGPAAPAPNEYTIRLQALDKRIADMTDEAVEVAAGQEREALATMAAQVDASLTEARAIVVEATAAAEAAAKKVAAAQARRGMGTPPKGLSKALADLHEKLGMRDTLIKTWGDEGRELRRSRDLEAIAGRRAQNAKQSREIFQKKADKAMGVVEEAQARKAELAGNARQPQYDAQLDAVIDRNLDEAVDALKIVHIAEQEYNGALTHRAAARTTQRNVEKRLGSQPPGAALSKLDTLRNDIEKAREMLDVAADTLPPTEAAYVKSMAALSKAQATETRLVGLSEGLERQSARAARLSTPEAQKKALEASREILARQARGNQAYRAPQGVATMTEKVTEELLPKADLLAAEAALPSTAKLSPPVEVRKAIEKVQVKGKVTARDVRRGLVDNETFKVAPQEIRSEYNALLRDVRSRSATMADQQRELIDRATTLAEFMGRYKAAIDAGAEAGDELAARVTREVVDSEIARTKVRFNRMSAAVDAVEDSPKRLKELKTRFADRLFEQADRLDDAVKQRQAVAVALKKADTGEGVSARRIMGQEDLGGAGYRQEIVAVSREADENLKAERQYFTDMLRVLTGHGYEDRGRSIRDALRMVKPKGSQMTDKELLARAEGVADELWASVTPESKAALMQDMRRQVLADQRSITELSAKRTSLGGGDGEVTADWRDVLLSRQGEGTVQSKREGIEQQLGVYEKTEGAIAGARADLSGYNADLQNAIKSQQPAIARGPQAQAELDALPRSARDIRYLDELDAMSDQIKGQRRQAEIEAATDTLDAVMRRVDAAAADELKTIDQAYTMREAAIVAGKEGGAAAKAQAKQIRDLMKANSGINVGQRMKLSADEFQSVVDQLPNDPGLAPVYAQLAAYNQRLASISKIEDHSKLLNSMLSKGNKGKLTTVFKLEAAKGWSEITDLLPEGQRIAIRDEMREPLARVIKHAETGEVFKAIDTMTQFFKTYATATPGFHVRNAMSATFMNFADGARLADHVKAVQSWKAYKADPMGYLAKIKTDEPKLYDAFMATFGSGAGGAFSRSELGIHNSKLMSNWWTRKNQGWGSNVEGGVRLALAIRAVEDGAGVSQAMARVSRIHFDYSQLSKLDKNMKRAIPFWTFMSRNLPLQLQQIYMRPALYNAYGDLVKTLGEDNEFEGMPQWLKDASAIPLGPTGDGGQHVLAPDLPHLNLSRTGDPFDLRNPGRAVSNLNPLAVAPLEAISGTDFYTGSDKKGNPLANFLRDVAPPVAQIERLSGTGKYDGKAKEKWANFFGIPYREVTDEMIANAIRSESFK